MSDDVYLVLDPEGYWVSAHIVELEDAPAMVDEHRNFRARRMPRAVAQHFVALQAEWNAAVAAVRQYPSVSYRMRWQLTEREAA